MKRSYLFDVDGTLTPSRGVIQSGFKEFFRQFCIDNDVYLVTGSNREKTIEQVGPVIYTLCKRVYQCAGNDVWEGNNNVSTYILDIPGAMIDMMYEYLEKSKFQLRTGGHIDMRPGLVNFSVVGRGCSLAARQEYVSWDRRTKERETIAEELREMFPEFEITVAGETGVDITLKGKDKSQILKEFDDVSSLHFFGDKMELGGNDYTLSFAIATKNGKVSQVRGWEHTWEILKAL